MFLRRLFLTPSGQLSSRREELLTALKPRDFVFAPPLKPSRRGGRGQREDAGDDFLWGRVLSLEDPAAIPVQLYNFASPGGGVQGLRTTGAQGLVSPDKMVLLDKTLLVFDPSRRLMLYLGGSSSCLKLEAAKLCGDPEVLRKVERETDAAQKGGRDDQGGLESKRRRHGMEGGAGTGGSRSKRRTRASQRPRSSEEADGFAEAMEEFIRKEAEEEARREKSDGSVGRRRGDRPEEGGGKELSGAGTALEPLEIEINEVFPEPRYSSPRHLPPAAPLGEEYKISASSSAHLGWPARPPLQGRRIGDSKAPRSHSSHEVEKLWEEGQRDMHGGGASSVNAPEKVLTRPREGRRPLSFRRSLYRGVTFNGKRWLSHLNVRGKPMALGIFDSSVEAAYAYDEAARRYLGRNARTNFGMAVELNVSRTSLEEIEPTKGQYLQALLYGQGIPGKPSRARASPNTVPRC